MKINNVSKEELLRQMVLHLMLNASFVPTIGLYYGKMGIVLFFAHYGRYAGNRLYNDFAIELLDEIMKDVHDAMPIDFEDGLCGIGWGIEYLLQNGFMDRNADKILSDVDNRMMESDILRITDQSLRTGLGGLACYVEKRIGVKFKSGEKIPFDEMYLKNLNAETISMPKWSDNQILSSIIGMLPDNDDVLSWKLGLENGCAGFGLNKVMELA
jgi:hypothetical protein